MSPSSESASRRAESREERRARSRARNGHTDGDDVAEGGDESNAVGPALRGAAAAAALGAALGAARALAHREDDAGGEGEDEVEDAAVPEDPEPEPDPVDDEAEDEPDEEREAVTPSDTSAARPEGASSDAVRSVAAKAREQFRELHGKDPDSLSALERLGGGGWRVTLEVVEVERVPDSTDVLATYVIELDGDGRLTSYERLRRYYRAQADLGEGR